MDTYRGNFVDRAESGDDWPELDSHDEEVVREQPPSPVGQDERRMQVRAYNHWASLLGDRSFPSIEDLDPENLPDFGPYSVLLDFTGGIENPAIPYLGDKLAAECGTDDEIETLDDVPSRSLLSRITDHYMQILANQAPIGFEAEFVNQRESTIAYRGILLPFSSDDDTIDFIYGVINWKELADQHTTDELMLEIDQALESPVPEVRQDELTDWADGPAELAELAALEPVGSDFDRDDFASDEFGATDVDSAYDLTEAEEFGGKADEDQAEDDFADEFEDNDGSDAKVLDLSGFGALDRDEDDDDDQPGRAFPAPKFGSLLGGKNLTKAKLELPRYEEDEDEAGFDLTGFAVDPVPATGDVPVGLAADTDWDMIDPATDYPLPALSVPEGEMDLADWLASARELAEAARGSEDRTRQALYAAIGRAYDFSLAAAEAPEDFAELVADSGLTVQDRAPMTPVVKLVFGADYDKTRLTEYASALSFAHRVGLARGTLAEYLATAPGGLKGVVGEERRAKRAESGVEPAERDTPREALARKLRKLEVFPFEAVPAEGSEFTLLVARRLPTGEVVLLGEVGDDVPLLEKAAKRLLG